MLILQVKGNSTSGQKFIYIPRKSDVQIGDYVKIKKVNGD